MPLVTQLSEGVQPLVFPTDLSLNALDKQTSDISTLTTSAITTTTATTAIGQRKSPTPPIQQQQQQQLPLTTSSIKREKSRHGSGSSTPLKSARNMSSSEELNEKVNKLNQLSDEEATALMLKAAAEKANSGNLSDTSYSEDNNGVSAVAAAAAAADFSLCNINILSSISAMNSLISVSGNGGLGLGSGSAVNVTGSPAGSAGSSSMGGGHPCPECGRVYKLKSSLRNHQKWECGKEPQFQCPFCVYRAKQKMHIGRHMERMHKEKFIKLEDLKSFTSTTATSSVGAGGAVGGTGSGSSGTDENAAAAVVAELRQHFSN